MLRPTTKSRLQPSPDELVVIQGQASHLEEDEEDADRNENRKPFAVHIEADDKDAHDGPEDDGRNQVVDRLVRIGGILEARRVDPSRGAASL